MHPACRQHVAGLGVERGAFDELTVVDAEPTEEARAAGLLDLDADPGPLVGRPDHARRELDLRPEGNLFAAIGEEEAASPRLTSTCDRILFVTVSTTTTVRLDAVMKRRLPSGANAIRCAPVTGSVMVETR